jgi:hypothetical protein
MTSDAIIARKPALCFDSPFARVVTRSEVTLQYDSSSELENAHWLYN